MDARWRDGIAGSDEAKAALTAAIARLDNGTVGADLQIQVSDLIEYLKTAIDTDAGVNGQTVTDMVRELDAPPVEPAAPPVEPTAPTVKPTAPVEPTAPTVKPAPPADPSSPSQPPNSTLGLPDQRGPIS